MKIWMQYVKIVNIHAKLVQVYHSVIHVILQKKGHLTLQQDIVYVLKDIMMT